MANDSPEGLFDGKSDVDTCVSFFMSRDGFPVVLEIWVQGAREKLLISPALDMFGLQCTGFFALVAMPPVARPNLLHVASFASNK